MNYNAKDCPAWISSLFRTQLISFFWCFTVPMLYCQFSLLCYSIDQLGTVFPKQDYAMCPIKVVTSCLALWPPSISLLMKSHFFCLKSCFGVKVNLATLDLYSGVLEQEMLAVCMRSKKYKTPQYIRILRCFGTSLGSNSAGLLTRHKAKTQKNMEYWKALHPSTPERSRAFNQPSTTFDPNFQP